MTTTFYSTPVVNSSFFAFEEFSQAFHRTPSDPSLCSPPPIPEPEHEHEHEHERTWESIGCFVDDFGLASCTEPLGFESSNMMISDTCCDCDCCSSNRISEEFYNNSSVNSGLNGKRREKRSPSPEKKKDFPPPLSSLSENGRRNFTLKPVRNNGRLEIVRVLINRPEILWSSRQNGRLRLHLVSSLIADDDEEECEAGDHEERESNEEEEEEEEVLDQTEEEERESEVEETAAAEAEVAAEEEREWKIPTIRRCYQREVLYAWSQQQNRCVTTM